MTIGVVIPCRGYSRFLRDCLRSVQAQEALLSVVVVNDAGDDAMIVEDIAREFRVSAMHFEQQRGIGIARNVGAGFLGTDYFLFLDADDTLHPGAVTALESALRQVPSAAFAYGEYTQGGQRIATPDWDAALLEQQNVASYCNLWRRDSFWSISGYRTVEVAEDWDLQRRAAAEGLWGVKIKAPIFDHRLHADSKWKLDSQRLGGLAGVSAWLKRQ